MNGWNMKSVVHSVVILIIIKGRRHCGIKMNGWNMKSVVDVCSRWHCGIKNNGWNMKSVVDSVVDGIVVLK